MIVSKEDISLLVGILIKQVSTQKKEVFYKARCPIYLAVSVLNGRLRKSMRNAFDISTKP